MQKYTTTLEFEPTIHQATEFINSSPKKSSIMQSREILNKYLKAKQEKNKKLTIYQQQ